MFLNLNYMLSTLLLQQNLNFDHPVFTVNESLLVHLSSVSFFIFIVFQYCVSFHVYYFFGALATKRKKE